MSNPRERIAERLSLEILEYVIEEFLAGRDLSHVQWFRMKEPDRAVMEALGAFERGEISYAELEAVGVRYVEAWEGI